MANTSCMVFAFLLGIKLVAGVEEVLTGYHFVDNELEKRFGPDNGYASFNTENPIPDQVKYCSSTFYINKWYFKIIDK